MARPICFDCGKQLMYVKGGVVYKEYTDPIGNTHKLHKDCYAQGGYGNKALTVAFEGESSNQATINEMMFKHYPERK